MSINKLERVMWRLRMLCKKEGESDNPRWLDLKRAIMYECGTDPSTYRKNRKALLELGWILNYESEAN